MNNNVYDDSTWDNDSNFFNESFGYDNNENTVFGLNDSRGTRNLPMSYMELPYRMERLEEALCELCKQSKKQMKRKKGKGKHQKSKHQKSKTKKFEKRLKAVEKENSDLKMCLAVMVQQSQAPDKLGWLKRSFENSAPYLVDFASDVARGIMQLPSKTPTLNETKILALPDKRSMK